MLKLNRLMKTTGITKRYLFTQEQEVLFETINNAGVITLNRPKVLNSLNISMLKKIVQQLREWENNKSLVIIKGAGDKAFCPGGDVKQAKDPVQGPIIFAAEYNANYCIRYYKIPYVALTHGITMGGGLGLAIHGKYRVATENTIVAMPETKIGLIPDAGGTYFLPRMQDNLGIYLGLTGERLKGKDTVKVGFATHFVSSQHLQELQNLLTKCSSDGDVKHLLDTFNEPAEDFTLAPIMQDLKYCFGASTVEEIIKRLEEVNSEWSVRTSKILNESCPGSLKITLEALQRGANMELPDCLRMEYRLTCNSIKNHDFPEGVRALLIDKDKKPQWNPKTLAEVNDKYVQSFFEKLPQDKELRFLDENYN